MQQSVTIEGQASGGETEYTDKTKCLIMKYLKYLSQTEHRLGKNGKRSRLMTFIQTTPKETPRTTTKISRSI